jgi:hypothetical protein
MATKDEMLDELKDAGKVDADASADDFKADELKAMLSGDSGAETVADTIENAPGIDPGNIVASPVVQSTTDVVANEGAETSMPNVLETEPAPPISTQEPDVPIAQTLAAGAGAHTPPDPDEFDKEGRPRSVTGSEA